MKTARLQWPHEDGTSLPRSRLAFSVRLHRKADFAGKKSGTLPGQAPGFQQAVLDLLRDAFIEEILHPNGMSDDASCDCCIPLGNIWTCDAV